MRSSLPLLILGAMLISSFSFAAPLAYWSMDAINNGVLPDASGRGHDATAYGLEEGKLPEVVPGLCGNCLKFTGSQQQYLEIQKLTGLAAPATFTVMAWIKPNARNSTYEIIGNKGDRSGDDPCPGWRLRYTWTRVAFEYGAADLTQPLINSEEWAVPAGFWSHLAVTYDGKRMALYIDCKLVEEMTVSVPILAAERSLVIGNYVGRKNAYAFDGLIDEVKLFDTVLSENELFVEAVKGWSG